MATNPHQRWRNDTATEISSAAHHVWDAAGIIPIVKANDKLHQDLADVADWLTQTAWKLSTLERHTRIRSFLAEIYDEREAAERARQIEGQEELPF